MKCVCVCVTPVPTAAVNVNALLSRGRRGGSRPHTCPGTGLAPPDVGAYGAYVSAPRGDTSAGGGPKQMRGRSYADEGGAAVRDGHNARVGNATHWTRLLLQGARPRGGTLLHPAASPTG